jgi:predicted lipoprotein with Yx(FWY)xxD motif
MRCRGAGKGVAAGLLGTTKRSDGRLQATYGGKPVYYYGGDSPGNIRCQAVGEFGGGWYVVKPSGKPVL